MVRPCKYTQKYLNKKHRHATFLHVGAENMAMLYLLAELSHMCLMRTLVNAFSFCLAMLFAFAR